MCLASYYFVLTARSFTSIFEISESWPEEVSEAYFQQDDDLVRPVSDLQLLLFFPSIYSMCSTLAILLHLAISGVSFGIIFILCVVPEVLSQGIDIHNNMYRKFPNIGRDLY